MDVQDFQLRYEGTVVMIHLYIRANQDLNKLQKNVFRAAKGPRLDALAAWTELYPPGQAPAKDASWSGAVQESVSKFLESSKQEVVVFHLCINTDTDPQKLNENIRRAARGPRFDDLISVIELYKKVEGEKAWSKIQRMAQEGITHPSAVKIPL